MAVDEIKNRIKIYLLNDSNENQYLKEDTTVSFEEKNINNCILNCRIRNTFTPKWYKNFFELDDLNIKGDVLSCYFDKTVTYSDKSYKFVISFGGADTAFDLEKFVDNFGLKVAFNICDKFVSVQKNNISTTMSNNKEYATRKDSLSSFVVDKENDLLNKVTISPKADNGIAIGNVTGGVDLSLTTTYIYNNIEELLEKIIEKYLSEDYKKEYDFIDNIKSIENNKSLLESLKQKVIELITNKNFEKVWFGLPLIDEWHKIESFKVYLNSSYEKVYDDIYIKNICDDFSITDYKDLKRIKVYPQNADGSLTDYYRLSECLYGEIEINDKYYVVNGEKFYNINKDYTDRINRQYESIEIFSGLPERNETGCELKYNKSVEERMPEKYKSLDQEFYYFNKNKIELCDLIDVQNKTLIHVKKYGASSVLSHLFLQALNSAELIANKKEREKIISYYQEKYQIIIPDESAFNVVMAIITTADLQNGEYLKIPFFSKMSVVSVVNKLESFGFIPKIAFIHSTVDLTSNNANA